MCVIGGKSCRQAAALGSFAACAFAHRTGVRSRNHDFNPPVLGAPFRGDANDTLYQWESSADYKAAAGLERIQAALLAINSADDERNPPELGLLDSEIKRVKNGRVLLIPASDQTAGHGTTFQARLWRRDVAELLQSAPRSAK